MAMVATHGKGGRRVLGWRDVLQQIGTAAGGFCIGSATGYSADVIGRYVGLNRPGQWHVSGLRCALRFTLGAVYVPRVERSVMRFMYGFATQYVIVRPFLKVVNQPEMVPRASLKWLRREWPVWNGIAAHSMARAVFPCPSGGGALMAVSGAVLEAGCAALFGPSFLECFARLPGAVAENLLLEQWATLLRRRGRWNAMTKEPSNGQSSWWLLRWFQELWS